MSTQKKYSSPKIFEFRIKYNAGAGHSAQDNYHYYNAQNASEALSFHLTMMDKHHFNSQTISVERKNPWADRWEDESDVINQHT